MLYAIYCEDKEDTLEKRRSVRPAHLKRLELLNQQGRLLLAGPLFNDDSDNPITGGFKGSLIIAEFPHIEEATAWAAADPYVTADIYARVTVSPFKKVLPQSES